MKVRKHKYLSIYLPSLYEDTQDTGISVSHLMEITLSLNIPWHLSSAGK